MSEIPGAAAPTPRFQRLRDRLAHRPVDTTLRHDIPDPLVPVLRHWLSLANAHDAEAAQRAGLRLGISPTHGSNGDHSFLDALRRVDDNPDLLDVIDAVLAVHRAPNWFGTNRAETAGNYAGLVANLRTALEDTGSAFTVDDDGRRLIERIDPTVDALLLQVIAAAPPTTGELLRDAREHVYGLHPDPTAAYDTAVRAVEEIACPLVLAKSAASTRWPRSWPRSAMSAAASSSTRRPRCSSSLAAAAVRSRAGPRSASAAARNARAWSRSSPTVVVWSASTFGRRTDAAGFAVSRSWSTRWW